MTRLTKKVGDNYCSQSGDFYDLYNKLGQLEDIFELIEEMYKKPVYWKRDDGEVFCEDYTDSTILYNPKTNEIEIYKYGFIASYKVEEYGITWWLKKDKKK